MRKMSTMNDCPLCKSTLQHVNRHLRFAHKVLNQQERKILVNLANGHTNIRGCPCPVVGCVFATGKLLERHIFHTHTELSPEQQARMVRQAKYLQALQLLTKLRATDPTPPMVSTLDLEPDTEAAEEAPAPPSPAPSCGTLACVELFASQKKKTEEQQKYIVDLEQRVRDLQRSLATAKRTIAAMKTSSVPYPYRTVLRPSTKRRKLQQQQQEEEEEQQQQEEEEQQQQQQQQQEEEEQQQEEAGPSSSSQPLLPELECDIIEAPGVQDITLEDAGRPQKTRAHSAESTRRRLTWSAGTGKGNVMDAYLDRFVMLHSREYGTSKMREYAKSRVSRVKAFLYFMSEGKGRLHECVFLHDIARLQEWVHELRNCGKEITTVR
ncbi:mediator of RNA polymerase II transcription subunit 15-like [Kryptolebias marmoratus]|uniref:mediator of RNA polymerase II transcription subunit 15-like n=1 Tax=Kryptolebias marmoratus TaxID=37003 RepID=UPI0018ACA9F2|nr:mediator of RNA polymerase II transcription subunit 15-like [Kryptolebias marmoratus]XP_037835219.1 mediator of RNA polymerase II transcription subunit 15-like [Kryptolebias marmoratus]